jgi:hypothetical protein
MFPIRSLVVVEIVEESAGATQKESEKYFSFGEYFDWPMKSFLSGHFLFYHFILGPCPVKNGA